MLKADPRDINKANTRVAIMNNTQTRPDVFGSRLLYPLAGSIKPLPTHPPIVGNSLYNTKQGETPGTKFFRGALMNKRKMMMQPLQGIFEANQNSPLRY